jgi:hypothetical protein
VIALLYSTILLQTIFDICLLFDIQLPLFGIDVHSEL